MNESMDGRNGTKKHNFLTHNKCQKIIMMLEQQLLSALSNEFGCKNGRFGLSFSIFFFFFYKHPPLFEYVLQELTLLELFNGCNCT